MIWMEEIVQSLKSQQLTFINGNNAAVVVPFRYAFAEREDIEGQPAVVFFLYDYAHATQYETSQVKDKKLDFTTNPPTVKLYAPPIPFVVFIQFEVISWDPLDDVRMLQAFWSLLPPRGFWPVTDPETGLIERIFIHQEDFATLDEEVRHAKVGRRYRKALRYAFHTSLDPKKVETAKAIAQRIITVQITH